MGYDVSSWFIDQLQKHASEPKRVFLVGSYNLSDWVVKWPAFTRTANQMKSVGFSVPMANHDGMFNQFYDTAYLMVTTCTLQVGFTHPTSGHEFLKIFTGHLKNVKYIEKKCILNVRDRLWDFTEKIVGDSDNPVTIPPSGDLIPSDIAWTLCTCYGGLDSTQSSNNTDIDYDVFLNWAGQFSADNVLCRSHYEGMKITEALDRLGKMTDSAILIEGDGKINFKKFTEPDSLDMTLTDDEYAKLIIDVESRRLVNKQYVYWDYAVASDYWQSNVYDEKQTSINTFGLHEDIIQDETIWYVDSVSALVLAQRRTMLLQYPPKRFNVQTGLHGVHRQIGETIRLVDSFYGINSSQGWRMVEYNFNMESCLIKRELDEATVANAFYLDVSSLDGDDYLL